MNPLQQNKVDLSKLSPDEQRLLRLYGKLPNKKDLLQNKLKERKYFDSGDYALSKAGKASDVGVTNIGSQHPSPENIPHLTSTSPGTNNGGSIPGNAPIPGQMLSHNGHHGSISGISCKSPVKEASFLNRETSADKDDNDQDDQKELSVSPPAASAGVPIRQS